MLAQHFTQPRLQQVRGGVIAHGGLASFGADRRVHFVAYADWLLGDDLMGAHALNRVVASFYFCNDGVQFIAIEDAAVADLASGFGVERSVVEDDFDFVSGFEFFCALAIADDG